MSKSNTTPSDSTDPIELTEQHTSFLQEAGASQTFIQVLETPKEDAGVHRHSIRDEIRSYIRYGTLTEDSDPAEFQATGGHFFTALWEGDLFAAWNRADPNNSALMMECLTQQDIIESGVARGEPRDWVTTMVTQKSL